MRGLGYSASSTEAHAKHKEHNGDGVCLTGLASIFSQHFTAFIRTEIEERAVGGIHHIGDGDNQQHRKENALQQFAWRSTSPPSG